MLPVLWATGVARACGGFFCDYTAPVNQAGETVVFEIGDQEVTVHALIAFQGDAEDFAWVLPTPGVPEVFLSWTPLFDLLDASTSPQPRLTITNDAGCLFASTETDADADADADTDVDVDLDEFIDVLATTNVGQYEGVVLDAQNSVALVDWLQLNGYAVPNTLAAAAAPYLKLGMNFLALKLEKGATVGDLKPLGLRWEGSAPSIPIALTAVAAMPDMPLDVYVYGDTRAVPLSYLHVELNPLVFDWFGHGLSWQSEIGKAADEAGGRAFATLYAQPAPSLALSCEQYDAAGLEKMPTALSWFTALPSHGFTGSTPEVLDVLRIHVPAPPGISETQFYNFPASYKKGWAALDATFDAIAATQALTDDIVLPCQEAEALTERHAYLTRLMSTMSADEMTVDPIFGFNPDLPDVSRVLSATYDLEHCADVRTLSLPGGYVLHPNAFDDKGLPSLAWQLAQLEHRALLVEQLSESGPGEPIADYRDAFGNGTTPVDPTKPGDPENPDGTDGGVDPEESTWSRVTGCGCASAARPTGGWLFLPLGGALCARRPTRRPEERRHK